MATGREETAIGVGIDLGTTYSCVAIYQKGKPEVLANDHSNRTTPSYVAFTEFEKLIGEEAKNLISEDAENTVFDSKRMLGRRYNDQNITQNIDTWWPFKVNNSKGYPSIEVTYKNQVKNFTPEQISSMVLEHMKDIAEQYLGQPVTNVVITVPAYFDDAQRKATKDAASIAKLNVQRLLNEPTAAAIAYGLNRRGEPRKNVMIYDLGGGTFDVCIMELDDGVFDVKATNGDPYLGGQDFDKLMVSYFVDQFKSKYGIDLSSDVKAIHKLRSKCEIAKRSLSTKKEARVEVDSIRNGIDLKSTITQARFEELCDDLFRKTLIPVEKALMDAHLRPDDIDEIVLVGGSTKIPKVREVLREYFGGRNLNFTVNADEAVALGAAIQAAMLDTGDKDESLRNTFIHNVQPLTLGTDLRSGLVSPMIPKNTRIPAKRTKQFVTTYDGQTEMMIQILEGERPSIKENNLLGVHTFNGIPSAPAGERYVEVTFEVDANGMLAVTAFEKTSGRREHWLTQNSGRLTQEEIEEKILEAEQFRAEDERERKRLVARNDLEHLAFDGKRKLATEFGDNLLPSDKSDAEQKVDSILLWIDSNTNAPQANFDEKLKELQALMNKLKAQQPSGSSN